MPSNSVTIGLFLLQQTLPPTVVPELIPYSGPITLCVGRNMKVTSRYIIHRKYKHTLIDKWWSVLALHPYLQIGVNVMHMLYEGTDSLFLFIDDFLHPQDDDDA